MQVQGSTRYNSFCMKYEYFWVNKKKKGKCVTGLSKGQFNIKKFFSFRIKLNFCLFHKYQGQGWHVCKRLIF